MRSFILNTRYLYLSLFLVLSCAFLGAQESSRGDQLTIKIAVMGPGTELYFWWGHLALIIEDSASGSARFYDWGIFSFESDHFFSNFALGRLWYQSGVSRADRSIDVYVKANRDVSFYTLDLPALVKEELRQFADTSVLPENRRYRYHHFKDNCSTRIRDIIDMVTGGQFKQKFDSMPSKYTLRQHIRRYMYFSPFWDWLLNFLMGQDIDAPISVWQEMFLPQTVGTCIADFSYTDTQGQIRPLVSSVEIVNQAQNRPVVLDSPRRQWIYELVLGLALAVFFAYLMSAQAHKPSPRRRVVLALSQSALGLFFGIAGSVLYFMSFFTDHDYCRYNANVLYISPLLLAAIPLGIIVARNKNRRRSFFAQQLLVGLWTVVVLGGVLSMLIKLSPNFYQQNQATQALVLPFALVLAIVPRITRKWQ
ncbi:MAG: DUF4105 domain-containing protein [Spirochaetaceae bacterium]|jgi:hypothetical protein|nr:DUF4105 domain-containing protein [Spirochaetaceae bacterium]